ncbi:hypothetical protein [Natrinema sp. DC36]|uniref:hypothetical protein n=1 Tax=Natrinema sp. DC36 TaxID=2878680 RepID=UPI001CF0A2A9|nr:hypothetical protein [Natrinema sp. DC36]
MVLSSLSAGGTAEFLEYVNTEYAGEYQREDRPATDVAQEERHLDGDDIDESADEQTRLPFRSPTGNIVVTNIYSQ